MDIDLNSEELKLMISQKIRESIKTILKEDLLNEYAYSLKDYIAKCQNKSDVIAEHVLKIVMYRDNTVAPLQHWARELYSFISPLINAELKIKANKSKYLEQTLINNIWGDKFSEYQDVCIQRMESIVPIEKDLKLENSIENLTKINQTLIQNFYLSILESANTKNSKILNDAINVLIKGQ